MCQSFYDRITESIDQKIKNITRDLCLTDDLETYEKLKCMKVCYKQCKELIKEDYQILQEGINHEDNY